ncbi:MAG: ABC transporter ATP-binding protein [Thermoanaerobaculia bacterium]
MADYLILDRLEKRLGQNHVTRGVSLAVGQSEIVALLGPSGSGKTTILRLIAGFEAPDAGEIHVGGDNVTEVPPQRRRFGMVFQHYALFPHMTVAENVAFGLESRGVAAEERRRRIAETLAAVELPGFEARPVTQLSGGQQQRVALARALAPRPRVLLLDEPLSNLDPTLRERTRRELRRLIRLIGITTLFVTHEQEEAFDLGDRVAVLNHGRLEQVGSPEALYESPATRFVATFIGRSSVLPGTWQASRGEALLPGGASWRAAASEELADGAPIDLVVRPEGLSFASPGEGGAVAGQVAGRRFAGRSAYFDVALPSGDSLEVLAAADAARVGQSVFVRPAEGGPLPRVYAREGRE